MKIRYLIPEQELKCSSPLIDSEVERCSSDYRKADRKTLLFLLPGVNFDTYTLIDKYIKSSALAIVTEDKSRFPHNLANIIEVKNARKCFAFAMSQISSIEYSSMTFIGVTGTNGKTSTATMIHTILTEANIKCAFIGTGKIFFDGYDYAENDYSMTSPDPDVLYPILKDMQKRGCKAVVMEASSHALELDKLYPIPFKIGIFTGLSHEHLEFHKSMENYFHAKEKLIASSEIAIINFDDPWGKKMYEKYTKKSVGIASLWRSDSNAINVENFGLDGIRYTYQGKSTSTKIKLSLPGFYNIYNSMLAIESAYRMNVPIEKIKSALMGIKCIKGRFETITDSITVILDYAHTPLALESVLETANGIKKSGQKITLVFGCGGERDFLKRPLMAKTAEKYADRIIVTNDNPRSEDENKIISDILSGFELNKHGVIADRKEAIEYAVRNASDNDIVIIAGKGHEKYIKDKKGTHLFDEKIIVKNSLKLRNKV